MSQSRTPSPALALIRAVTPPFSHEDLSMSLASHALDDASPDPVDIVDLRRVAAGEITSGEYLAIIRRRYGKNHAQA